MKSVCTFMLILLTAVFPAKAVPFVKIRDRLKSLASVKVLVYDLAEGPEKKAVLEACSKEFKGWKQVDLQKIPEDKRVKRLGNGFVFVSLFSQKNGLLQKLMNPTKIATVTQESVTIQGKQFQPAHFSVVFVAKNSYGAGPCVAFGAYSASSLKTALKNSFSWHSASAFEGKILLNSIDYTEDFELKKKEIPLDQALFDVNTLYEKLNRIHPDLLHKVTAKQYVKMKQKTIQSVVNAETKAGNVRTRDLAAALYRATAFFGDGHTHVEWFYQPTPLTDPQTKFPPFILAFRNGKWFVKKAISEYSRLDGAEIQAVNGKTFVRFIRPVLTLIPGESLPTKANWLASMGVNSMWWSLSGMLDSFQTLDCQFVLPDGKRVRQNLRTIDTSTYQNLFISTPSTFFASLPEKVVFSDGGRICYFHFPAFNYSAKEKEKIDKLFHQMHKKGTQTFIMDIRGNGGGNSGIGDYIISYLTTKKFRAFSKVISRISKEALDQREAFFSQKDMDVYRPLLGCTITEPQDFQEPEHHDFTFTSRFILLTDNGTFSSASDFATVIKGFHLGTIIGYETGGLPTSFGDDIYIILPYSRIPCAISYCMFVSPVPLPGADKHGVEPDIPVTDALLKPYKTEKDPLLSLTMDIINGKKPQLPLSGTVLSEKKVK